MNEPGNNTAWRDRFGDTWVRSDEAAQTRAELFGGLPDFRWWPLCDSENWNNDMRGKVGVAAPWPSVEAHGPLEPGDSGKVSKVVDALARELR